MPMNCTWCGRKHDGYGYCSPKCEHEADQKFSADCARKWENDKRRRAALTPAQRAAEDARARTWEKIDTVVNYSVCAIVLFGLISACIPGCWPE